MRWEITSERDDFADWTSFDGWGGKNPDWGEDKEGGECDIMK